MLIRWIIHPLWTLIHFLNRNHSISNVRIFSFKFEIKIIINISTTYSPKREGQDNVQQKKIF